MKKILITGKDSYIGTSFERWIKQNQNEYEIDTIDVKDHNWKNKSFENYDAIFHVAGIAHIKETKKNKSLYYQVNRDLSYEIAQKAKLEGVKHFIFLSSMSVYGLDCGVINFNTPLAPKTAYGKSKLEAENCIKNLSDNDFIVSIIRPPMVYGKGCKGNYNNLKKIVRILKIFPNIENKRSMIYIDNLSEMVRMILDNIDEGLFFPQNEDYFSTKYIVKLIAKHNKDSIKFINVFNSILKILLFLKIPLINKVFGTLIYEKNISNYKNFTYCVVSNDDSIYFTERY